MYKKIMIATDGSELADKAVAQGLELAKAIGADARREIAEMIEAPVHLFLFVKVRERWGDDPDRYREMGLEFPKE